MTGMALRWVGEMLQLCSVLVALRVDTTRRKVFCLFSLMPTIRFAKTASVSVAPLQHCCLENHCPCTDNASVFSAHERFHFFGFFKNFFSPLFSRHFITMKFEVICLNPCLCVNESSSRVSRQSAIESNDCPPK